MRDFFSLKFKKILNQINSQDFVRTNEIENESQFNQLFYFLIKNFYYPAIVDDYLYDITNKESLLEAMFYQVKLITVHDLNWDAIQEGLNDALNNFLEFEGIILMFRQGTDLLNKLSNEFRMLSELITDINKTHNQKQIKILMK